MEQKTRERSVRTVKITDNIRMNNMKHKEQRVLVLFDVQNMYYSAKHIYNTKVNFKEILGEAVAGRRLVRAIAYVIKTEIKDEVNFHDALNKIGIEVKAKDLQVFVGGAKKGDWDIGIAMDAIRMQPKVDTLVLVSGDGDFKELLAYMKSHGCRTEVIAIGKTASKYIREEADHFFDLESDPRRFLINYNGKVEYRDHGTRQEPGERHEYGSKSDSVEKNEHKRESQDNKIGEKDKNNETAESKETHKIGDRDWLKENDWLKEEDIIKNNEAKEKEGVLKSERHEKSGEDKAKLKTEQAEVGEKKASSAPQKESEKHDGERPHYTTNRPPEKRGYSRQPQRPYQSGGRGPQRYDNKSGPRRMPDRRGPPRSGGHSNNDEPDEIQKALIQANLEQI